jgi:short-subunit dehydrogenase
MQLKGKQIVLTGAAGGMGELIAQQLAAAGAKLVLTDLDEQALNALREALGEGHTAIAADLCSAEGREQLLQHCIQLGGIDMLINMAGMSEYALLENQSPQRIELMMKINLTVPMLLCQMFQPLLTNRPDAAIVNIGSTFGSIGHPGFSSYCASKFGLRGFTESLRRELSDTRVAVFYIAPRATQTRMNSAAVIQLNEELGNTMDAPEVVVSSLMRVLTKKSGGDYYFGWPEKLFVRVNALLPQLVGAALGKQLATIKRLAG